ncbi:MAG: OmpA family protein [Oceanospirillum sp.]|nr:OmpA family protein [Oceanospirillum sp.]
MRALLISVFLLTCYVSSPSQAQEGMYVGGFYEAVTTDSKKKTDADYDYIDSGNGPGLELGVLFTPEWGARLEWGRQDYDRASALASGGTERRLGIDLMYRFTEKNHLYTFAGFKSVTPGLGHSVINAGLGGSIPVADRWSVFAEGAVYQGMKTSFTDLGTKAGIRYQFYNSDTDFINPHKPVHTVIISVPEPDLDKDGVIDRLDLCPGTPMQYLVNEDGCTIAEQFVVSMQLNVLFPNDSSDVDPAYYPEIKKVADFMARNPETAVEIGGHTSAPASFEYNLKLSDARAKAVARVLVDEFRVDPARVTGKGYGESRLLDPADNEMAHSTNRRIEAIIYAVDLQNLTR